MSQDDKKHNSTKPGRKLGPWYVFAVVFTTLFIVGVICWTRKPVAYSTRGVVRVGQVKVGEKSAGRSAKADDKFAASLTSIESLRALANELHLIPSESNADSKAELAQLRSLQRSIGVSSNTTIRGEQQVVVTHVGQDKDDALRVTTALVEKVAALQAPAKDATPSDDRVTAAKDAVAQSKKAVELARQRLADFQQTHAGVLGDSAEDENQLGIQGPDLGIPDIGNELSQGDADVEMTLSPAELQEKQDRLAVLLAARAELAQTKTEIHPSIRDLTWQIEQLKDELAAASVKKDGDSDLPKDEAPSPELVRLREEQAALEAEVTKAEQKQLAAVGNLRAAKESAAKESQPPSPNQIVEAPHVAANIGGGTTLFRVFVIGVLSALLAAGCSLLARADIKLPVLSSVAHARSLGLPVVATLTTGGGPELLPVNDSSPAIIRWATWLCEIVLVLVVLLLIVVMIADAAFATLFFGNPVESLGATLFHLKAMIGLE